MPFVCLKLVTHLAKLSILWILYIYIYIYIYIYKERMMKISKMTSTHLHIIKFSKFVEKRWSFYYGTFTRTASHAP